MFRERSERLLREQEAAAAAERILLVGYNYRFRDDARVRSAVAPAMPCASQRACRPRFM